jgi:hypothetical protein
MYDARTPFISRALANIGLLQVRKHNPLVSYDSVSSDANRLAKTKNFTMFYQDLAANKLPQWMFITPNMSMLFLCYPTYSDHGANRRVPLANDGHDSSVTVAGAWAASFLTPLLSNKNFNTDRTLIILTFDECENYLAANRVYAVLLGGVIPTNKIGTSNGTSFNHYSLTKTVEDNWGLGNLGQNDVSATAFY